MQFAFPDNKHSPTTFHQSIAVESVALDIAQELWFPIFSPCAGHPSLTAILMLVPETAMDEYHSLQPAKHQIRGAWKRFDMETIPVSQLRDEPPDQQFRFGVLCPNLPHIV
jgi:hypothetical protein